MKLKQSFVIVLSTILVNLASGRKKYFVVPYAINAIIEEHFVNLETYPGRVDIFFIGKYNFEFSEFMNKLLKIKSANTKVTISKTELNKIYSNKQLGDSSIVVFDSVEKFVKNASTLIWTSNKRYRNHQLVYVPGLTTSDIVKTFQNGYLIDHVNFLMHETDNSIELVTAYMFTPQACKKLQLKTINRFDLQTLEWDNSIFYPNKYENFYGCELIVTKNSDNFFGFIYYNLLEMTFKEQLNAKLTHSSYDTWDCERCDLISYETSLLFDEFVAGVVSDAVSFHSFRILIGPGEPYTDLERMFMMFDFQLWVAIAVTFFIALIATLALSFTSRKFRNIIVGRYNQNPTVNLISTFLSGSQYRTPGRNSARFLLILFIIWSLIIRTCHQSMLFKLMQSDLRRPTIKTLDEFFKSNLSFYNWDTTFLCDEFFVEQMTKPSTRLVD